MTKACGGEYGPMRVGVILNGWMDVLPIKLAARVQWLYNIDVWVVTCLMYTVQSSSRGASPLLEEWVIHHFEIAWDSFFLVKLFRNIHQFDLLLLLLFLSS